ncbi:MAG: hypothetical protein V7647_2637 [Acidobacteriota bacterium]
MALAVGAIVIAALYVAQDVLIPITLAVILSFVLSPLVNLLGRLGLWRAPAVLVSVLVALGAIALVGMLIGNQAASLAVEAPRYAETIQRKVQGVQEYAAVHFASVASLLPGSAREGRSSGPAPVPPRAAAGNSRAAAEPAPLLVEIARPHSSPFVIARTVLTPVLGPLETMVIVVVVAIFILLQKEELRDRFIRLVGSSDLNRTMLAIDDAARRLSRYFVSQLAVNATFGLVIGLGLWAIGVPSPAVWGVLSGILRFVPYVGPVLAAFAPIGLAAAIDPGWSKVVYVALLYVVVEPLTGYVVEPLLYGHSTGLSPISVIVAAVFWTWMWGPIGLILSTPLTLCLVVIGRHAKPLEFFDVLLGDRPALPAVDRFYQRILADDPDEILDQAETLLASQPLEQYYDEVVLQGLKRAAEDQARGTIPPGRAAQMTHSMLEVIGELEKTPAAQHDVTPGITGGPTAGVRGLAACISGRGPFDDAVSAMLDQLLRRSGVATRVIPYRSVSRDALAALDLSNVSVIALSYLELSGSPAHLRYLIARLRQRAPGVSIVLGLWPSAESGLGDPAAQKMVGADRYVASLREAVEATRAALGQQPTGRVARGA